MALYGSSTAFVCGVDEALAGAELSDADVDRVCGAATALAFFGDGVSVGDDPQALLDALGRDENTRLRTAAQAAQAVPLARWDWVDEADESLAATLGAAVPSWGTPMRGDDASGAGSSSDSCSDSCSSERSCCGHGADPWGAPGLRCEEPADTIAASHAPSHGDLLASIDGMPFNPSSFGIVDTAWFSTERDPQLYALCDALLPPNVQISVSRPVTPVDAAPIPTPLPGAALSPPAPPQTPVRTPVHSASSPGRRKRKGAPPPVLAQTPAKSAQSANASQSTKKKRRPRSALLTCACARCASAPTAATLVRMIDSPSSLIVVRSQAGTAKYQVNSIGMSKGDRDLDRMIAAASRQSPARLSSATAAAPGPASAPGIRRCRTVGDVCGNLSSVYIKQFSCLRDATVAAHFVWDHCMRLPNRVLWAASSDVASLAGCGVEHRSFDATQPSLLTKKAKANVFLACEQCTAAKTACKTFMQTFRKQVEARVQSSSNTSTLSRKHKATGPRKSPVTALSAASTERAEATGSKGAAVKKSAGGASHSRIGRVAPTEDFAAASTSQLAGTSRLRSGAKWRST
jgi:hypothetical protein